MKYNIDCPLCLYMFNCVDRKPFINDCGAVCCENCYTEICVFCGEKHSKISTVFEPIMRILRKIQVKCVSCVGIAEYIDEDSILFYCKECSRDAKRVLIRDAYFADYFDGIIKNLAFMVNENIFKSCHAGIDHAKNFYEKLHLAKNFKQILEKNAGCSEHPRFSAIGIDSDLNFRCLNCYAKGFKYLSNAGECKGLIKSILLGLDIDDRDKEEVVERLLENEDLSIVQIVTEFNLFRSNLTY